MNVLLEVQLEKKQRQQACKVLVLLPQPMGMERPAKRPWAAKQLEIVFGPS